MCSCKDTFLLSTITILSTYDFAHQVVHEDPHFNPDYASASFSLRGTPSNRRPPRQIPTVSAPEHLADPNLGLGGGGGGGGIDGFRFSASDEFTLAGVGRGLGKKKKGPHF